MVISWVTADEFALGFSAEEGAVFYRVVATATHATLDRGKIMIFVAVTSVDESLGRPCSIA
jgi:hypothetical protein